MNTKFFSLALSITALVVIENCGKNVFSQMDNKKEHKAIVAMEEQNPDKAISILESETDKDPENYQLVSLLSAAYAQKYGIDMIKFAQTMADKKNSTSSSTTNSGNGITVLFAVLPNPTDENINGIIHALDLLLSIPSDERTAADNFKLAILQTCVVSMTSKKYDTDGDGNLSPAEITSLSIDDAKVILKSLLAAQASAKGNSDGKNAEAASATIDDVLTKINEEQGADDEEKLKNYLAKAS